MTAQPDLDERINGSTHGCHATVEPTRITCADGFSLSVISGGGTYCTPRPALCGGSSCPISRPSISQVACTYVGPFTALEVGYPSERPEPWSEWKQYADDQDEPTQSVYGFVPVETIRALVESHGGEAPLTAQPDPDPIDEVKRLRATVERVRDLAEFVAHHHSDEGSLVLAAAVLDLLNPTEQAGSAS